MEYMSVKEAAARWGISERRVRALCESGRIEGVTHIGDWVWSIPASTERPADGRTLRYMKNRNLKTGANDYKGVDSFKALAKNTVLTETQKQKIIAQAFAYDGVIYTQKQIASVFSLRPADIPFSDCVRILNMRNVINNLPFETNEKALCQINKMLMTNIDDKRSGIVREDVKQEVEALFKQYSGDWSILHPVARGAFLFTEILRLKPFDTANSLTAFIALSNEMLKAKLPPAIFDTDAIGQLRAALASAELRGNAHQLVSMIIEAITK